MSITTHNLLSAVKKRQVRLEYYGRIMFLLTLMLTLSFGAGVLALFPLYVSLRADEGVLQAELDQLKHDASVQGTGAAPQKLMRAVLSDAARLREIAQTQRFSVILADALAVRPQGVAVRGVDYQASKRTLTIDGQADNRTALLDYARVLENRPLFGAVPVPLANLARNADLPFSLHLTIDTATSTQL